MNRTKIEGVVRAEAADQLPDYRHCSLSCLRSKTPPDLLAHIFQPSILPFEVYSLYSTAE